MQHLLEGSSVSIVPGDSQVRVALYHRVSTLDQDPEGAKYELRRAAAQRQMVVAHEIWETGSGARNDRPGHRKLMKIVAAGQVDAVLVVKLDRFGRGSLDLLTNIHRLTDAGVRFVAVTQGLDIKPNADAMSRLMLTMLAAIAEFERDLIKERTRSGLENAKKRGSRFGRPAAPNAPSPVEVDRLRREGLSWKEIATLLKCSRSSARRASRRCVEKGAEPAGSKSLDLCEPKRAK